MLKTKCVPTIKKNTSNCIEGKAKSIYVLIMISVRHFVLCAAPLKGG